MFSQEEEVAKVWYPLFILKLKETLLFFSSQSETQHKEYYVGIQNDIWSIISNSMVNTDAMEFKLKHPLFFKLLNKFLTCFCKSADTKLIFKDLKTSFDRHLFNLLKDVISCFTKRLKLEKASGTDFVQILMVTLSEPLIEHALNMNGKTTSNTSSISTVKCFVKEIAKPLLEADKDPIYMLLLTMLSRLLDFEDKKSYLLFILLVCFSPSYSFI